MVDFSLVVDAVFEDLALVAASGPNERLPKEKQLRCCIYAALRPGFRVVCVERGYGSVDEGSREEADLWAQPREGAAVWMELKRCWSVPGWENKPTEQLRSWLLDLAKLQRAPADSERYFVLFGFFGSDPLDPAGAEKGGVVRNLQEFRPARLAHQSSRRFEWRAGDGIAWVGAWAWRWPSGVPVEPAGGKDSRLSRTAPGSKRARVGGARKLVD